MASRNVKQHDVRDCGAACLASIGNHYGYTIPIARIRQFAATDLQGTNVLGMVRAATHMGFTAKGVKGTEEALHSIPLPAIAHTLVNKSWQHYVVLYKVSKNYLHVMDPAVGTLKKIPLSDFKDMWTGVLILVAPSKNFEPFDGKMHATQRFWNLIQPHKSIVWQAFFGAVLVTLLGLCMSVYIQKITDYVLVDGNRNLLSLLSIGMLLVVCVQSYIGWQKSNFILKTGQIIDSKLILGYYNHLMRLPQAFFDTMRIGEITSRISDAVKIRAFINEVAMDILMNGMIVLFTFSLMFMYNWTLALFMGAIIPCYLAIYFIVNHTNKQVERNLMEDAAQLETQLVETITHARAIKEFGLADYAQLRTENRFIKLLFTAYRSGSNAIFSVHASQLIASLFTVILLWAGSRFVIEQAMTPGELFSFYALIAYITNPISSLLGANKSVQSALIAADRLFEIMDLAREPTENRLELMLEDIGDIHFEKVGFSYGTRKIIFSEFDAIFRKHTITAIVGDSGEGKTTIFALLQNLYSISAGKIRIGPYDLTTIHPTSLRKIVSIVSQDVHLFAGNIIDNITLGDYEPDMKRVIELCDQLGMTSFIQQFPMGFNTYIGENGAMLSGGQKQRISMARALYRNPEILLLDEATSSLDATAQQRVLDAVQRFKSASKTVIMIAHRLSTIVQADMILVLQQGKIVEQGNHADLLAKRGHYFQQWEKQFLYH